MRMIDRRLLLYLTRTAPKSPLEFHQTLRAQNMRKPSFRLLYNDIFIVFPSCKNKTYLSVGFTWDILFNLFSVSPCVYCK